MSTAAVAQRKGLTLLPLIAATYFMVSGGPYGLEDLVQKSGYGWSLLLLAVTPLVWSLPVALLVGELSAALPEDGGYYAWVRRALGPFWGFQEAWLSLAASIFDMAIYPTLFVLYLGRLWPQLAEGWHAIAVGAAMIAACTLWNIAGARAVGNGSVLMMYGLLAPFAVLTVAALFRRGAYAPAQHRPEFDLVGGVLVAMWNYMGWDNASTIAREVDNPQRTYPRAMMGAVVLIAATYMITVGAVARTGMDPGNWSTGSWVDAGRMLSGAGLGLAIVVGGMLCGLGMFNALVLSYSRVPMAMAEDGFLPSALAKRHPKTGAPWVAILVCAAAWTACLTLGFERLVEIDVLLYGFSLLLEFVALWALRVKEPLLPRPYRIPGGLPGAVALAIGPIAVLLLAGFRGRTERAGPISALTLGLIIIAAGVLIYWVAERRRGKVAG
jgi:amino acid transporter